MYRSDPGRTRQRVADLESYMGAHVLTADRRFVCGSLDSCRSTALFRSDGAPRAEAREFWRGQLSHVGEHYDLAQNGASTRIVFVGMETGRADEGVTLAARRAQQDTAIYDQTFRTRKPHMRGTTSALRILAGSELGDDADGEWLDLDGGDRRVHLMEAYALVNVRLCSAVAAGTTSSRGTDTMTTNCLPHLAATLDILEPDIVVLQSTTIRPALTKIIDRSESVDDGLPLERVRIGANDMLLASFPHPYQQGRNAHLAWGQSARAPYLLEVVEPTLRTARSILV